MKTQFLMKTAAFYKKYLFLIKKKHTWPTYKKTQPLISPFIKKLIFQKNRDPCLIIRTEHAISTFTNQSCASKHLFMNSNHIDRLKMENIPYQFQKSTFLASGTNSGFRNLFHRTWKWNMAKIKITHLQYLPCKCSWSHSDQITSQQDLL